MSHLTQMVGLAVQNFVSAAAGMAVVVAIIRGIVRRGRRTLGNFWVDLTRTTLRILLPLSFVVAVAAVARRRRAELPRLHRRDAGRRRRRRRGHPVDPRRPGGQPDRDQAARHERRRVLQRQLGPPVREPEPGSPNFIETLGDPRHPVRLRRHVRDPDRVEEAGPRAARRDGRHLDRDVGVHDRRRAAPATRTSTALGVDQGASAELVGGNLEGKEVRFGPASCGLWAASTTGTSNGSVNCMHDSFTPIGGMFPMST